MTTVPDDLRAALGDSYDLEKVIGQGGMATVYLARDRKHSRKVAIKVLRADLAAAIGPDRFIREIEIAAGLNHPNILPLHDSCDTDGCLHYVMPFVDGESLRELLNRKKALDLTRALEISGEVADALTYAHRNGIVHRDIKPENILLSEGHAVVADFGIAKAVRTLGGENLTRTGFPLGTPGYMSPEQAAGMMDLDNTTDVYSLACVFYEMVVGAAPEMWPTDEATRLGRFVDASPGHRQILDRLPGQVERVLTRAMAFRSADRFQSPVEFSGALKSAVEGRRFVSDDSAREIVRAAADLQEKQTTGEDALSLGGVQQIAAEVGIPPDLVDRVARSLDAPLTPTEISPFLGAAPSRQFERVVQGELSEAEYAEVIEHVRSSFQDLGNVSSLKGSLTWHSTVRNGGRDVQFTITARNGQSKIVVQERFKNLAGALFGGLLGGIGGGVGVPALVFGMVFGGPAIGVAGFLASFGGAYALARGIFVSKTRKHSRELEQVMDRVADHVSQSNDSRRLPPAAR